MTQARALIIPVTPFQQNCTLLWSEASKRGAVVDPGGDLAKIERAIDEAGVTVEKIWLTHGHVDHASGAAELRERLRVPIEGPHRGDLFLLEHLVDSARAFGLTAARNVTGSLARRGRQGQHRRSRVWGAALSRSLAGKRGVLQPGATFRDRG